jgi:hypothetical protein
MLSVVLGTVPAWADIGVTQPPALKPESLRRKKFRKNPVKQCTLVSGLGFLPVVTLLTAEILPVA